jgi:hypothetical protein
MNSDWLKDYEARRAQELAERPEHVYAERVEAAAELLASHGIKAVVVTYAGSGDEGCTEAVYCLAEPCEPDAACQSNSDEEMTAKLEALRYPEDVPEDSFLLHLCSYWSSSFDQFVGDLLSELAPSGYENSEGGQGTIVLDTEAKVAKVRHGTFVTEVEYESYSIGKAAQ